MSDDFKTLLGDYAEPVADNGFSDAVMKRVSPTRYRIPVLAGAAGLGGVIALPHLPELIEIFYNSEIVQFDIAALNPLALTALGVLGFITWAALDRGWGDAV